VIAVAFKDWVDAGQKLLDFLKSSAITLLVVTILIWPTQLSRIMNGLGIHEFEFLGLKGKTALLDIEQQLRDQRTASRDLEQQLTEARVLLEHERNGRPLPAPGPAPGGRGPASVPPTAPAPGAGPDSAPVLDPGSGQPSNTALTRFLDQSQAALARSASTQQATQATLNMVAPAIAAAQSALPQTGGWAIVFSGDTTEAAAAPELNQVRNLKIGSPQLYLRQKWYRGTLTYATQAEATANLAKVRALGRIFGDAYVVNLMTWCPVAVQVSPTLVECRT
jgi:hypothetical protein